MRPEFEYGEEVRVLRNLRNDGTYPGTAVGQLLVRCGSTGFIRDMGTFLQDQIVYSVHFLAEDRLVGCRGAELQPADAPWTPSRFEVRDKVVAGIPLGVGERVLVDNGEVGEVLKVLRDAPGGVCYHVHFEGRNTIQVPESALEPSQDGAVSQEGGR